MIDKSPRRAAGFAEKTVGKRLANRRHYISREAAAAAARPTTGRTQYCYVLSGGGDWRRPTWRPSGCGKKNLQEARNDCVTSSRCAPRITARTQCSPRRVPTTFSGAPPFIPARDSGRPLRAALLQCLGGLVPSVEPGPGDADTAVAAIVPSRFIIINLFFFCPCRNCARAVAAYLRVWNASFGEDFASAAIVIYIIII